MVFDMLTKETLDQAAASELRTQILQGALPTGSRLVESRLSVELGVSRPTIRAALQLLSEKGLATRSAYEGWSVAAFNEAQFREVVHLRAVHEGLAARLIVEQDNPDLSELDEMLGRLQAAEQTNVGINEADHDFHLALVGASNANQLVALHQSFSDQLRLAISAANLSMDPSESVYAQHASIMASLSAGDPSSAEQELRQHCLAILERVPTEPLRPT